MVPVYEFKIPQWPKNIKNYPNSDEEIKNQIVIKLNYIKFKINQI